VTARQSNLLGALAVAVHDRLHEAIAAEAERGGQAAAALAVLAQQSGLGIEGLRRQLRLSQPATVRLVDALVGDGLAVRRDGPDRRSVEVRLTRAGRARAEAVLSARRAVLDDVLATLSAGDRAKLERLIVQVLGGLTADRIEAEQVCRLCDLGACPLISCPVEQALPLT
jgi:DNA-binding MarR family transcriptional regulator